MTNHPLLTKTCLAIVCITAIIVTCIIKDIDTGIVFTGICAVSGLGGFIVGKASKPK